MTAKSESTEAAVQRIYCRTNFISLPMNMVQCVIRCDFDFALNGDSKYYFYE